MNFSIYNANSSFILYTLYSLGSRIGVVFVPNPNDSSKAEMHFIINGEDQGPCTKDIPYKDGPLHAVVDVYGTTKQVKIIQLYGSELIAFILIDQERSGYRLRYSTVTDVRSIKHNL